MKLLLLHPRPKVAEPVARLLERQGIALVQATDPAQAIGILRLHGMSVDAAIFHREGASGAGGLQFPALVRKEPALADLPMVMTSDSWSEVDFAKHQDSPDGVNAYLRWPDCEAQLLGVLEQVLGREVAATGHLSSAGLRAPAPPPPPPPPPEGTRVIAPGTGAISLVVEPQFDLPGTELRAAPEEIVVTPAMGTSVSIELDQSNVSHVTHPESVHAPDAAAERELPYLFGKSLSRSRILPAPVGDAVVPGGASQAPDVTTLKHYLELREKDVSALSIQLREARELQRRLEEELKISHRLMDEQESKLDAAQQRERSFERERALLADGARAELEEIRFELKAKNDKVRLLQARINEEKQEMERLRERVRSDIRAIKTRERELENKLEMARSGFDALLAAREATIIELKRKLDLTEFNLDLVQDKLIREKDRAEDLKAKLARASQAVRVAGGLLDQPGSGAEEFADASGAEDGAAPTPLRKTS